MKKKVLRRALALMAWDMIREEDPYCDKCPMDDNVFIYESCEDCAIQYYVKKAKEELKHAKQLP
jgi:hypothetical protein